MIYDVGERMAVLLPERRQWIGVFRHTSELFGQVATVPANSGVEVIKF